MNMKLIFLATLSALVTSISTVESSIISISIDKNTTLANAANESENSNWQKVLAAAKKGTIDLGRNSPSKPWLLMSFQGDDGYYGGHNYIKSEILDQDNSSIDIKYLLSTLANPPIVSGSLVLFIFEKSIGVWQTQNQAFKLDPEGFFNSL